MGYIENSINFWQNIYISDRWINYSGVKLVHQDIISWQGLYRLLEIVDHLVLELIAKSYNGNVLARW